MVNHFIPFTEQEVGAPTRFRSDFMAKHIAKLSLTPEAKAVMSEGRKLWEAYYDTGFGRTIRDDYALRSPDVGWYQVRMALDANQENRPADFGPLKSAYAILSDKLRPQVFEYGFLLE